MKILLNFAIAVATDAHKGQYDKGVNLIFYII